MIKVLWGANWDPLLARDTAGLLRKRMEECVDGEYQAFKARGGAFTRENFFGKYPELKEMIADLSDYDIWRLDRGGHDAQKVYAAYAAAVKHKGQPTVILAKTVKGYGMGEAGEGQNITHQQKKMGEEAIKAFRDRFKLPIPDEEVAKAPYYRPAEDSPEIKYIRERRQALGGYLPQRRSKAEPLPVPDLGAFDAQLKSSGDREFSTTMAFVRMLTTLLRDKQIGKHVVPIVADEARTFGMEGLFRQLGIYSTEGQLYRPEDAEQLMYYREDKKGQILEEGITEAGALCSWIAAGTSYSNHGISMIPFFIYYSMFGFQRFGDLAWAAGDMQVRGFLMGGTAGRTTLAGEGLQHQDGHSHVFSSVIPNCVSYDPTFSYEVAVIIHDGLRRMYAEQENIYYVTVMNENYAHPAMPEGVEEGIRKGLYLRAGSGGEKAKLRTAAGQRHDFARGDRRGRSPRGRFRRLRRHLERAQLHRAAPRGGRRGALEHAASGRTRAWSTWRRSWARARAVRRGDGLCPDVPRPDPPYISGRYVTLGTEGYGRSDTRAKLRKFFEVNRWYVAVAALKALADEGAIPRFPGHGGHPQVRDRSRKAQPGQGIKEIVVQLECLPRSSLPGLSRQSMDPRDKPRG